MPNKELVNRWAKEALAMTMIGDGLLALVDPDRHVRLYMKGPAWWRRFLNTFAERPGMTRALGAAELGLGIWLAEKQKPLK
jgi:hypothetical protein